MTVIRLFCLLNALSLRLIEGQPLPPADETPSALLVATGRWERDRFGHSIAAGVEKIAISALYSYAKHGTVSTFDALVDGGVSAQNVFVGPDAMSAYGHSVAMDKDMYLFVGSPSKTCEYQRLNYNDCGVVYVYNLNASFPPPSPIYPLDKFHLSSQFGMSIAVASSMLFVGSPGWDNKNGMVSLFRGGGDVWVFDVSIHPPQSYSGSFGYSLALNEYEDLLVVGAPYDVCELNFANSGSVYLYKRWRSSESWEHLQTLLPSVPTASSMFGATVAINSAYEIIVGASGANGPHWTGTGAAYIFSKGGAFTFSAGSRLYANDGESGDGFGCSVAISDKLVAVGACYEDGKMTERGWPWQVADGANCGQHSQGECRPYPGIVLKRGSNAGAVYTFEKSDSNGTFHADSARKILPDTSGDDWMFGSSVLLKNGVLLIGAEGASDPAGARQIGALYAVNFLKSISSDGKISDEPPELGGFISGYGELVVVVGLISAILFLATPVGISLLKRGMDSTCGSAGTVAFADSHVESPSQHGLLAPSFHGANLSGARSSPSSDLEAPHTQGHIELSASASDTRKPSRWGIDEYNNRERKSQSVFSRLRDVLS